MTTVLPASWLPALPAPQPADAIALALLALFAAWGGLRGPLRQVLSIAVLGLAFFGVGRLGPALEPTVAKLAPLEPGEAEALAWALAVFAGLVAGAIVLRFVGHALPACRGGLRVRAAGALLGAFKGAFVLVVVGYLWLGGARDAPGPTLSRTDEGARETAHALPLAERLGGTLTARGLSAGGRLLTRWLDLPPWLRGRIDAADRRLEAPPAARPDERPGRRPSPGPGSRALRAP